VPETTPSPSIRKRRAIRFLAWTEDLNLGVKEICPDLNRDVGVLVFRVFLGVRDFLQKPFSAKDLFVKVRDVLDSK
jgi:hypothetical protein